MAHYRFNNLLGAPYRGGNLCLRGHHLISSVGNRVSEVDLQLSSSTTLPCENLTEIRCVAVSPSGHHMLSFDTDGRAILVNVRCVLAPAVARSCDDAIAHPSSLVRIRRSRVPAPRCR